MSYEMKKTGFSLKENIALLSLPPPNSKGVLGRSWMAKKRYKEEDCKRILLGYPDEVGGGAQKGGIIT